MSTINSIEVMKAPPEDGCATMEARPLLRTSHCIPTIVSDRADESVISDEKIGMQRYLFATGIVLITMIIAFFMCHDLETKQVRHMMEYVQQHQMTVAPIYVIVFALSIISCAPSTLFEIFAGCVFGVWYGLALATSGKISGCVISFCIGRYFFRARVQSFLEQKHPYFRAIQQLVDEKQLLVVFLIRIACLPIAIKNYGLSVLNVHLTMFFTATVITGVPYSFLWVITGNTAQSVTNMVLTHEALNGTQNPLSSTHFALIVLGIMSSIVLICFVGMYTKRYVMKLALKDNEEKDTDSQTQENSDEDNICNL